MRAGTEAIRAALAGRSPRQAGRDKERAALRWIYRWGWSSPAVVDLVASPGRRGLAARLVRKGLADGHPAPGGGGIKGTPTSVLTLTETGVSEVEAVLPDRLITPYPSAPERTIPWHQLRHDALVQLWTARRLADGLITEYTPPRELSARSVSGVKQPDAVWRTAGGLAVAVELELTAKKDRELHQAVAAIVDSVHPGSERRPKGPYDAVAILSHSPAILARYRSLLAPGARIPTYERDPSRHWRAAGHRTVPEWISGRVVLELVEL